MAQKSALIYVAVDALIAKAVVWGVLLPWARYRYTAGASFGAGLLKPVVLLAIIGGAQGLATFAARRAVSGR